MEIRRPLVAIATIAMLAATAGQALARPLGDSPLPVLHAAAAASLSSSGPYDKTTIYAPVGQMVYFSSAGSYDKDSYSDPEVADDIINSRWQYKLDGATTWTTGSSGTTCTLSLGTAGKYLVRAIVDDAHTATHTSDDVGTEAGLNGSFASDPVTVYMYDVVISKCASDWIPSVAAAGASPVTTTITTTITPSSLTASMAYTLTDVTTYTGYCSNAGTETTNDLAFQTQTGWNIGVAGDFATSASAVSTGSIAVTCLDYGAYGKIKCDVYIGGITVHAHVAGGTATSVTIPLDDNNNMIADAWTHDKYTLNGQEVPGGLWDDDEATPTGVNNGDGLPRIDEYRGFLVNDAHKRPDPDGAKDFFVYDESSLGLGYLSDLGLTTHLIKNTEWDPTTHVVNTKGANANQKQYAVRMHEDGYSSLWVGYCNGGPGLPSAIDHVDIFMKSIRKLSDPTHDQTTVDEPPDSAITDQVIAHELSHAVSIVHHVPETGGSACIIRYPCPSTAAGVQTHFCTQNPGCKTKIKLH